MFGEHVLVSMCAGAARNRSMLDRFGATCRRCSKAGEPNRGCVCSCINILNVQCYQPSNILRHVYMLIQSFYMENHGIKICMWLCILENNPKYVGVCWLGVGQEVAITKLPSPILTL